MDEFKGGGISVLVMLSSLSHCDPYRTWTASPGCAYRRAGKKPMQYWSYLSCGQAELQDCLVLGKAE